MGDLDLVLIPAGTFRMGNPEGRRDEQPTRVVTLAAFRAARGPVTNEQFDAFVSATGRSRSEFRDDPRFSDSAQPVVGVSWHDAVAYCEWLSAETETPVRLSTEAEREYASFGGMDTCDWPWGSEPPDERAEFTTVATLDRPHVPSDSCANGYGLQCVAENVHEWCSDWYDKDAYQIPFDDAPGGPSSGTRRVSRGGSWRHSVKFTRLTARASLAPSFRYNDFGFRVYADA